MAPYASSICLFQNFLGSLGARFLPGFGFKPLRPVRITPVYFPGWFIDAEASADFKLDDTNVLFSFSFHGIDARWERVGSLVSLRLRFDLAQSATDPIELQENINLIPSSIHTGMFAAYPVLFPLYLALYEHPFPGKERLVTLFIEAATPKGRIQSEKLDILDQDYLDNRLIPQVVTHALDGIDVLCIRGRRGFFFRFSGLLEERPIASMVNRRLNDINVTHDLGQKLVKKSGLITSDADPRIRPFTLEERKAVQRCLSLSQDIQSMTRLAQGYSALVQLMTKDLAVPQNFTHYENKIKSIESEIAELRAKKDAVTPLWWKEWRQISQ
ncbi:hypothetical protein C0995_008990 [Termitomyces sp. Mi166|nr:hypothetical protein C0995_008990 [Termitomyces sp. Mi166\